MRHQTLDTAFPGSRAYQFRQSSFLASTANLRDCMSCSVEEVCLCVCASLAALVLCCYLDLGAYSSGYELGFH